MVKQERNIFSDKTSQIKSLQNETWDCIYNDIQAFNIEAILREDNMHTDSLVVSAITFKVPVSLQLQYQIEVRYKPSIPDNMKHWQVFEDDKKLKKSMQTIEEFSCLHIDEENNETIT